MLKPWREIDSKELIATPSFTLREHQRIHPTSGRSMRFYVVDTAPWVNVIPITDEGKVVMVRQYRHGPRTFSLECPGGIVHPGEQPVEAARRELLEETGFEAKAIEPIGEVHTSPAILDHMTHFFLAREVRPIREPRPDAGEDLELVTHSIDEIEGLIRCGEITHSQVICAFHFLRRP